VSSCLTGPGSESTSMLFCTQLAMAYTAEESCNKLFIDSAAYLNEFAFSVIADSLLT